MAAGSRLARARAPVRSRTSCSRGAARSDPGACRRAVLRSWLRMNPAATISGTTPSAQEKHGQEDELGRYRRRESNLELDPRRDRVADDQREDDEREDPRAGSHRHPTAAARNAAPTANVVTISRWAKPCRSRLATAPPGRRLGGRADQAKESGSPRHLRSIGCAGGHLTAVPEGGMRECASPVHHGCHDHPVTILRRKPPCRLHVECRPAHCSVSPPFLAAACSAAVATTPASAAAGLACPDPTSRPFAPG